MNKELLKKILETKTMQFSVEEVEKLMDEEISKAPEEMDTDLVELCIDVLTKAQTGSEAGEEKTGSAEEKKTDKENIKKKKSVKKFFLIAAVVTVLSLISISVSANVFDIDLQNGIVKILDNYISINLPKNKDSNLSEELKNQDLEYLYLLPCFYDSECIINNVSKSRLKNQINISFSVKNSDTVGHIIIRDFTAADDNTYIQYINLYSDTEQVQKTVINGIEVIVSSTTDTDVFAFYNINNLNYSIKFINTSVENVLELINTY